MNKYDIDYDFETIDGTEKLVVLIGNPDGDIKFPDNPNSRTINTHPDDSTAHPKHFHLTVVVEEDPIGYNSMNPLRLLSEKYIKPTEEVIDLRLRYLTIYSVSTENLNVIKRKRRTRTTVSDGIKDD